MPREWRIVLSDLNYGEEEIQAVEAVLRSGWLSMGENVARFEQCIAELCGVRHAVCVSSCTAGLNLLMHAAGIGPGDEVLLPSLTFVATANAIVNCGATPIFCDIISEDIPLIDPRDIARNLSPATKAVMTVDYAGYPCDYDAIANVIAEYKFSQPGASRDSDSKSIYLFEDAAHGIGGVYDEQRCLGNCGDAGVFSFFSNKNLVTGEGGMVVTNRSDLAERVRLLRQHGMTRSTWDRHNSGHKDYDVVESGWNFRPTEITAALGLVQARKLGSIQQTRATLVNAYIGGLSEIDAIQIPFSSITSWQGPACHIMPILLPDSETQLFVREYLMEHQIQTSHHYSPVHWFEFYRTSVPTAQVHLPKTESYAARQVTLPLHPHMTESDVALVVRSIKDALEAYAS